MAKKNLAALLAEKLAENTQRHSEAHVSSGIERDKIVRPLPVDKIDPNPYQPRRAFDETALTHLTVSIEENGLLQPISVRAVENGRYQLIAGERRFKAVQRLGHLSIEAMIISCSDEESALLALAENVSRADLSDYEIGLALRQMERLFPSRKKMAESIGINREDMYRYFSFEALPDFIQTTLSEHPACLSRAAATEIKRVLSQCEPEAGEAALKTVWANYQAGYLDQSKLALSMEAELFLAGKSLKKPQKTARFVVPTEGIYLASGSPRRAELLSQLGVIYTRLSANIDETPLKGEPPEPYVMRMAQEKARAAWDRIREKNFPPLPVLSADTVVILDGTILGKPSNAKEAANWWRAYSGQTHEVLTAVVVQTATGRYEAISRSQVTFCELTEKAIKLGLAAGDWRDKAGAYGIQGHAARWITRLEGSYSGVMGLPLYETAQLLEAAGVASPSSKGKGG